MAVTKWDPIRLFTGEANSLLIAGSEQLSKVGDVFTKLREHALAERKLEADNAYKEAALKEEIINHQLNEQLARDKLSEEMYQYDTTLDEKKRQFEETKKQDAYKTWATLAAHLFGGRTKTSKSSDSITLGDEGINLEPDSDNTSTASYVNPYAVALLDQFTKAQGLGDSFSPLQVFKELRQQSAQPQTTQPEVQAEQVTTTTPDQKEQPNIKAVNNHIFIKDGIPYGINFEGQTRPVINTPIKEASRIDERAKRQVQRKAEESAEDFSKLAITIDTIGNMTKEQIAELIKKNKVDSKGNPVNKTTAAAFDAAEKAFNDNDINGAKKQLRYAFGKRNYGIELSSDALNSTADFWNSLVNSIIADGRNLLVPGRYNGNNVFFQGSVSASDIKMPITVTKAIELENKRVTKAETNLDEQYKNNLKILQSNTGREEALKDNINNRSVDINKEDVEAHSNMLNWILQDVLGIEDPTDEKNTTLVNRVLNMWKTALRSEPESTKYLSGLLNIAGPDTNPNKIALNMLRQLSSTDIGNKNKVTKKAIDLAIRSIKLGDVGPELFYKWWGSIYGDVGPGVFSTGLPNKTALRGAGEKDDDSAEKLEERLKEIEKINRYTGAESAKDENFMSKYGQFLFQ